ACFHAALIQRANAVADFQADVPEQGKETLDGFAKQLVIVFSQQNQQINIRIRMQFATTVAADRHEGDVGMLAPGEAVPGATQDLIDEPGAIFNQAADIAALSESLVEHAASAANCLFEGWDGAALERKFGLELTGVEQFGIHLGHGCGLVSAT